jgi:hypothetical protein
MRKNWKIATAAAVGVLVGGAGVAAAALVLGATTGDEPTLAARQRERPTAVGALVACAEEQGLTTLAERLMDENLGLPDVTLALAALAECRDEVEDVADAAQDAVERQDGVEAVVADAAACLDRQGVTLESLSRALGGEDAEARKLGRATETCLRST